MSGQLREWLMAQRAFSGSSGLLIQHRPVPTPAGLSAPRAAGCPLRKPVLVAVVQIFHWCHHSWSCLAPWQVQGNVPEAWGSGPQAGCPWAGRGPGTHSCPWSSSGREPATGSSVITWGFMHGLNLNGKSREAPVYLLLLFI